MAAPIVYRWDDGNAPVARGERRSLCDILYACLVTGYGTKPGAGWTREYVNATFDKAAFRNNPVTGTGFFLQVDGAGATNAYTSNVKGFEAMTSESDGLMPFNTTALQIQTSNSANTTARPWILIADDRAFYFVCWVTLTTTPGNNDNSVGSMFFGDLVARSPSDGFACAVIGGGINGSYGYMGLPIATTGSGVFGVNVPRKSDGVVGPSTHMLIRGGGPGSDSIGGQSGLPWATGDVIYIVRPFVNNSAAYTMRGWLPGFYYPCHGLAFNQFQDISDAGKSFISLRHNLGGYGGGSNYFISLDDWRV